MIPINHQPQRPRRNEQQESQGGGNWEGQLVAPPVFYHPFPQQPVAPPPVSPTTSPYPFPQQPYYCSAPPPPCNHYFSGYGGVDVPLQYNSTTNGFTGPQYYMPAPYHALSPPHCHGHESPIQYHDPDIIFHPNDNDVLLGRGGHAHAHAGNEKLRVLARTLRHEYQQGTKKQKTNLSNSLVDKVHAYGGRFLGRVKDDKGGRRGDTHWHVVDKDRAREKTRYVNTQSCSTV